MATIKTTFGSGHANLAPGGAQGEPTLAQALRDVADDLAGIKPAAIVAATIAACPDPPTAAWGETVRSLVNEIKTSLNASAGTTLKTIKG